MIKLSSQKKIFVDAATEKFGEGAVLSRAEIKEISQSLGLGNPSWFKKSEYRVDTGKYKLPVLDGSEEVIPSTVIPKTKKVSKPVPTPAPVVAEPVAQEAVMSLVLLIWEHKI